MSYLLGASGAESAVQGRLYGWLSVPGRTMAVARRPDQMDIGFLVPLGDHDSGEVAQGYGTTLIEAVQAAIKELS